MSTAVDTHRRTDPWPAHVRDILGGDQAVALAYRTPAGGTVVLPVTTLGTYDANAGTVSTTTSLGNWKKLSRIERDDRVAFAFHTRAHGTATAPHYLLVQGHASFPDRPLATVADEASRAARDRFVPAPKRGPLWRSLTHEYEQLRVPITVHVERIVAWGDEFATGLPEVHGTPLAAELPTPQAPPRNGVDPRVVPRKYRRRLRRTRHHLVGYVGGDGFPVVLPTRVSQAGDHLRIVSAHSIPPHRRAGVLAHWFEPRLVGQGAAILTGWLDDDRSGAVFSPHTVAGYQVPASRLAMSLGSAVAAKVGYRAGVRAGHIRDGAWHRREAST